MRQERQHACEVLAGQMDAEIRRRKISHRAAAAEIGNISHSTVSRLIRGGGRSDIDTDHEIAIRRWLRLPFSIGTIKGSGDTLADIAAALERDNSLDGQARSALLTLMTSAYTQMRAICRKSH